jgi:hypothetical protein
MTCLNIFLIFTKSFADSTYAAPHYGFLGYLRQAGPQSAEGEDENNIKTKQQLYLLRVVLYFLRASHQQGTTFAVDSKSPKSGHWEAFTHTLYRPSCRTAFTGVWGFLLCRPPSLLHWPAVTFGTS